MKLNFKIYIKKFHYYQKVSWVKNILKTILLFFCVARFKIRILEL